MNQIISGNYDEDFEEHAFEFVLMCDTRLTNYNAALAGYEFIVTYNPDMEVRLLASWEYQNIQDLLEGQSGGRSNYELGIKNYELGIRNDENDIKENKDFNLEIEKRVMELDELVDRDPVKKHLKKEYVKSADENIKSVKDGINVKKNPNDEKLKERSKQNIYAGRNLTRQQKEIRRIEDLKLLLNPENLEVKKNIENKVPVEYSLSQNYPNPFNPTTKINFDLPKDSKVSLTVYDLLGREIIKLVNNEFRTAGSYTIEFNAGSLSSGVYFYRLETYGESKFIMAKRMILIK